MKKLGYRWVHKHRGTYFDGHEREDVVDYRQNSFIPTWYSFLPRMRTWDKDGNLEPLHLPPGVRPVVAWHNDESIYYANDRRQSGWVHESASPTPYTKGEGVSQMVGEYFSPDYGYLKSQDGTQTARVMWKPGKNRDGYFDNNDFMEQVDKVMDILESDYTAEDHLLLFDNATIHLKRRDDALSARRMPKFTPKEGCNWGIEVTRRDANGNTIHGPDGKPLKTKVRMGDTWYNGRRQSLYFEEGHPRVGVFKGMAIILQERGYTNAFGLRAECKDFKCAPGAINCCCRRILYNEPDFVNVKSILQERVESRGHHCLIYPKYHCELNPLEMVWGRSKFHYRMYPPSTKVEDLEHNVHTALGSVTLTEMRRYVRCQNVYT